MKPTLKEKFLQLLKIIGMIVLLILIIVVMALSVWKASFVSWTGFGDFTTPTGEFIRGKTVWDWMELLVIPMSLLIGGYLLNSSERDIERQRVEERAKNEQKRAEAHAKLEREIAIDRQQEATLQAYLDRMTELLLEKKLLTTKSKPARSVAKARTLSVLRGLNATRKSSVLLFLHETGLVRGKKPIIDLDGVDLSGVELPFADLSDIYLPFVNLSRTKFAGTNLSGAILNDVTLKNGDWSSVDLHGADLQNAILDGADLENANLQEANLRGIWIINCNLKDAKVTVAQVEKAFSVSNSTMPDGTIIE